MLAVGLLSLCFLLIYPKDMSPNMKEIRQDVILKEKRQLNSNRKAAERKAEKQREIEIARSGGNEINKEDKTVVGKE